MATNENVNKVIYGNQTVMDITDTTAEESDVASGEVFYKANGARSVGTLNKDSAVWGNISGTLSDQNDLQIELNRAYTKTASETSSIDDLDVIPVQKISASSDGRRNIKFKNLKSILKTYFDSIYSTFSGSYNDLSDKPTVDQTYSATSSNAQSGKAVAQAIASIPGGGGMLPYLYIDSEAGATVTVNQPDGTTITPTAAGSGHWECELTGGYGTYVIHSVLSGQGDATLSLAVDTVKEYHVTDTHYDYTINVTAPSGSSVRITGGGETYTGTGTGSSQAFAVHSPSTTYTVAVTMDGNTKSETITSAATSGQSGSVTIAFGTINLTYANDFRGKTITCTKSGVTVTKTAPSSGNTMTFRVPTTGTWTISGTVSGTAYSVNANVTSLSTAVSANLQTTINVNVTLHGAVGAVITYTDANGAQTQTLDSTGKKTNVLISVLPNSPTIVFTDTTVAKDPDNLSNNYTKSVTITSGITDIYVMPDNVIYWYGYTPYTWGQDVWYYGSKPSGQWTFGTNSLMANNIGYQDGADAAPTTKITTKNKLKIVSSVTNAGSSTKDIITHTINSTTYNKWTVGITAYIGISISRGSEIAEYYTCCQTSGGAMYPNYYISFYKKSGFSIATQTDAEVYAIYQED